MLLPVQCCPKSIKTTLNSIFSQCILFWSLLDNMARGFYLCKVDPWLTDNFYEENNLFAILSSSMWANIAQGNYLCNVGLLTDNSLQQNNLYHAVSIKLGQHCIGVFYIPWCPKTSGTTLHKKITYLCNIGIECTDIFLQENNLRNVVLVCLGQHGTRTITCTMQAMFGHSPQFNQCFLNTALTTLKKKITDAMLAQSAQIY